MASKSTSEEKFLNASLITGKERVRISKRQTTGQRLWENFQVDFIGFLRFIGFNLITAKSVTGNGTPATPIQLVNDEQTPADGKFYGQSGGNKGWFVPPELGVQTVTGNIVDNTDPQNPIVTGTALGGMIYIADIDVSANPDYPAASKGDMYRAINGTGRIGGGAGVQADTYDFIVCLADNAGGDQATVGTSWTLLSAFDPITKGWGESALQQTVLSGTANGAFGDRSIALGTGTEGVNHNSTAENNSTKAIGINTHAEGLSTLAIGGSSHTEGSGTRTGYLPRTFTHSTNQVIIAGDVTSEYQNGASITFYDLTGGVSNTVFVVLGLTITSNPVFGGVNTTFNVSFLNTALGDRTGGTCVMTKPISYAHAEGEDTIAIGEASHTEGKGTSTTGNGIYGHAEGFNTQVSGVGAHAEGNATLAQGDSSHASGKQSWAYFAFQNAYSEGKFSEVGDSQVSKFNPNALTTGNQTKILRLDNVSGTGGTISIAPHGVTQVWNFYMILSGIQIGGTAGNVGDCYCLHYAGALKKVASVLSVVGTPLQIAAFVDAGVGFSFDGATFAATGVFQVLGEADKNVRWSGALYMNEVAAAMV